MTTPTTNTDTVRFAWLKEHPRGFANEWQYVLVPVASVQQVLDDAPFDGNYDIYRVRKPRSAWRRTVVAAAAYGWEKTHDADWMNWGIPALEMLGDDLVDPYDRTRVSGAEIDRVAREVWAALDEAAGLAA